MTEPEAIELLSYTTLIAAAATLVAGRWAKWSFKTGWVGTFTWAVSWFAGLALAAVELF